jgi:hypothetical protein
MSSDINICPPSVNSYKTTAPYRNPPLYTTQDHTAYKPYNPDINIVLNPLILY